MADENKPVILNFGKHRGKDIEVVQQTDRPYLDWLAGQPFVEEKHPAVYNYLHQTIVNTGEAAETPEHNALQVLFLDKQYCVACVQSTGRVYEYLAKKLVHGSVENLSQLRPAREEKVLEYLKHRKERIPYLGLWNEISGLTEDLRDEFLDWGSDLWSIAKEHENHELFCDIVRRHGYEPDGEYTERRRKFGERAIWRQKLLPLTFDRQIYEQALIQARDKVVVYSAGEASFEENAIDVSFKIGVETLHSPMAFRDGALRNISAYIEDTAVFLEIKPTLGDEFPSVIRQILDARERLKRRQNRWSYYTSAWVLFVGEFTAQGATRDQITEMFRRNDIHVVLKADVDARFEANRQSEA